MCGFGTTHDQVLEEPSFVVGCVEDYFDECLGVLVLRFSVDTVEAVSRKGHVSFCKCGFVWCFAVCLEFPVVVEISLDPRGELLVVWQACGLDNTIVAVKGESRNRVLSRS